MSDNHNNPNNINASTVTANATVKWHRRLYLLATLTLDQKAEGVSPCDECALSEGYCENAPCGDIDQYLIEAKDVVDQICDAIMASKAEQEASGKDCWDEAADDLASNAPTGNENAEGWLGEDQESAEAFAESLERDALRGFPLANDARALAEKAAWVALDGKWKDLGDQIRKGAEAGDTWTEFCLYLSPISEIRPNLLAEFDSRLKLFGYRFKHRPSSSDAGTEVYQISW